MLNKVNFIYKAPGNIGEVIKYFTFSFLKPADTLNELGTLKLVCNLCSLTLFCLFLLLIQGPSGRSGLPGLPGADGPPVRALITYLRTYSISVLHTHTNRNITPLYLCNIHPNLRHYCFCKSDICLTVHTHVCSYNYTEYGVKIVLRWLHSAQGPVFNPRFPTQSWPVYDPFKPDLMTCDILIELFHNIQAWDTLQPLLLSQNHCQHVKCYQWPS